MEHSKRSSERNNGKLVKHFRLYVFAEGPDRRRKYDLNTMMKLAKTDVVSWRSMKERKAPSQEELGSLIQLYIDSKELNPD